MTPDITELDDDYEPKADSAVTVNGSLPGEGSGVEYWTKDDDGNLVPADGEPLSVGEILNSDYNESVEVHATASGTVTLDLSVANVHHVEATGDVTLEFENATEGEGNSLLVYLVDDDSTGPHAISWPASVVWSDGDAVVEIPADGDVEISLLSGDGSEWRGRESGRQFA